VSIAKLTTVTIQGHQLDSLRNCVRTALHQYSEDAKMFRNAGQHTLATAHHAVKQAKQAKRTKKSTAVPLITEQGAEHLAQQFEQQAAEAGQLYEQLEQAEKVLLVVDDPT
jgi:hypothetical protein